MNVLSEAEKFYPMTKVSSCKGGEYHGACPGCGDGGKGRDSDRFHVWPEQNEGIGSYWCRGCGKGGDLIQFLMDFCGKTFPEAAKIAGKELADEDQYRVPITPKNKNKSSDGWVPSKASESDHREEKWKEHVTRLVGWAHNQLVKNSEMMTWLIRRGIDKDAVVEFKLGLNTGKNGKDLWRPRESWGLSTEMKENGQKKRLWIPRGLVIPYIKNDDIMRIRIRRFGDKEPRYYFLPGGATQIMVLGPEKKAHVVIESELDAMMVFSKVKDTDVGVIGLGSSHTKPDSEADQILGKSLCILNALDYDRAGAGAYQWWKDRYARCKRWPVPEGKDPGEAYEAGVDILDWIYAGLPPAMTIEPSRLFQAKNRKEPKTKTEKHTLPKKYEKTEKKYDESMPRNIIKLYKLLCSNPVKIRNTPRQTTLIQNPIWEKRNWGVSKEISSLVFFDHDCREHIENHPEQLIGCVNFFPEGKYEKRD